MVVSKIHLTFAEDNLKVKKKIKQEYSIELLEEYDKVNFYSIRMSGNELTELEAFFEKFPEGCEHDNDIDVIISWLDQIAERGALERYFRPEGRYGDGVGRHPHRGWRQIEALLSPLVGQDSGFWKRRSEGRQKLAREQDARPVRKTTGRNQSFHLVENQGRHNRPCG